MSPAVVQIYEIQECKEAEAVMALGVDHVGSVLMSPEFSRRDALSETLSLVSRCGRQSSLIPLFLDTDLISRALDHYRPDIVHFCESLCSGNGSGVSPEAALDRQQIIRNRFPEIRIMRSIPIGPGGQTDLAPTLELAGLFEPISDFFLTDTMLPAGSKTLNDTQPVSGFVGITGKTCDWDMAAELVRKSPIPVILAGGISPDNAAAGYKCVRPAGVDSCTLTNAVNEAGIPVRFKKDLEKVKRLVTAVHRAQQVNKTEMEA